jgi:hypothetical protein
MPVVKGHIQPGRRANVLAPLAQALKKGGG